MINKKRLFKSLIIISLVIIIIFAAIQIRNTLARYETTTTGQGDIDVAFWVVGDSFKSERLVLDGIYPEDTPFEYIFTISNFDPGTLETETDDKIAETDMEYELTLTTTTNLPLTYEIIKNGTTYAEAKQEVFTDSDGTIYRRIDLGKSVMDTITTSQNEKNKITDTYTLKVTFPTQSYVNGVLVDNKINLEYPDLMENIKFDLTARQIID